MWGNKSLCRAFHPAIVLVVVGVLFLGCQVAEQLPTATDMAPSGSGVLYPEMAVETGSFDQPHAKLGEQPAQSWSATTVAAAVDGKPLKGELVTVVGEIVDYSCYFQVGKHGEIHRGCSQKCFESGMPIGLLARDGTLYLVMEEEHNSRRDGMTNFREAAIEHAAHIMEVTGTLSVVDDQRVLYVTGYVKS